MAEIEELSKIQKFYSGRSVFVTGVSGYLGKAILEKLLRSCSHVSKVYVLLRTKRGEDAQSRLQSILKTPIFDTLKSQNKSGILSKVQAINGDITLPCLGLTTEDRELICENVSVVIHSAASVKFTESLTDAMNINYYGTQRVLNLFKGFKDPASFVHISSAYANCDLEEIPEKILQQTPLPENLDQMSAEEVKGITPMVIGRKPNTYTCAKALAETLLQNEGGKLPICIVRPSMVCSAWKEPKPGFVDSLNGLTAFYAALGKGILTTMCADGNKVCDLIPLDVVVNVTIASGWDTSINSNGSIPVYNVCSGSINPIDLETVKKYSLQNAIDTPANEVFRYPSFFQTSSPLLNRFVRFFMMFIPFFFVDVLSLLVLKKPKMLRLYKKLTETFDPFDYFCTKEFNFVAENMQKLCKKMGEKDIGLFYWNIGDLNWEDYFRNYYLGIKSSIFKEDTRSLKNARERMLRLYWAHKALSLFIMFITLTIVIKLSTYTIFFGRVYYNTS